MKQLDLADIPGVGPALVRSLQDRGLVRIEDALGVDQEWLERWFGAHRGAWLYRRMRGLDPSRVDPREPRKSISSERTFARDLDTDEALGRSLLQRRSEEPFVRPASVPARLPSRSRTVTSKRVPGHGPPLSRSKPTVRFSPSPESSCESSVPFGQPPFVFWA